MSELVSFLVPAYNHMGFVEKCLNSILEDNYSNKELLIIDDGSKDGTRQVIERWLEKNSGGISVKFRARENRGIGATLNELISMANGTFVRLGASDDYFLPDGTKQLVDYMCANPKKMAVFGDSVVVDDVGKLLHDSSMVGLHRVNKQKYLQGQRIVEEVICNWAISGPVPLVRKDAIVLSGGWDEKLRIDDWDFFLKIAAKNALGFIDVPVCAYRLHGTNTCRVTDVQSRIRNLEESRGVASRRISCFLHPYNDLLRAQCRLIDAKISYLKRKPLDVFINFLSYFLMYVSARIFCRIKSRHMTSLEV